MKRFLFIVKTVFLLSVMLYNYAVALTVDLINRGIVGNASANAGSNSDSESYNFNNSTIGLFDQSGNAAAYASGTINIETCFPMPFGGSNCWSTPSQVVGWANSEATQSSNIINSSNYLSAIVDGSAYASASQNIYGSARAASSFEIIFSIDTSLPYSLKSDVNSWDNRDIIFGNYYTSEAFIYQYNSSSNYDISGTLNPGTYYIGIASDTHWGNVGDFSLNFIVGSAPVPEPSTMLLLGSGLVGLIGYGRRRMKK